jgi:hypothetical protein
MFISPRFFVGDWYSYGFAAPGYGQHWMRYYDDALLIDDRGYVYDMVPGVNWGDDRFDDDDDDGIYDDDGWYPDDDRVTYGGSYGASYGPAIQYVPMGTTTVVIQSPPVVTKTTYVEEEVVRPAPKKVWKAKKSWKPRKVWKPKPQCRC